MVQAGQAQMIAAPILKLWSDGIAMAAEGLEASQVQGKRILESTFELANATGKDYLKSAAEFRDRVVEVTGTAGDVLKDQASMFNDIPKDPVGVGQRVMAGYVEGARRSMEIGAAAMKSSMGLMGTTWSRMEKASQEVRESWTEYATRIQAIVEAKAKSEQTQA